MSYTVFLGNLPAWVTADDIRSWLTAENLVADQIKVIRNPETQESKGFAFIEAPNQDEMQAIIRRFDRAPLEDRLLRANPAQPPKTKRPMAPSGAATAVPSGQDRGPRRTATRRPDGPPTTGTTTGTASGPTNGPTTGTATGPASGHTGAQSAQTRPPRERPNRNGGQGGPQSAFAQELAKAL